MGLDGARESLTESDGVDNVLRHTQKVHFHPRLVFFIFLRLLAYCWFTAFFLCINGVKKYYVYAEVMKTMMFFMLLKRRWWIFFWNFGAFGSSLFVVLQLFLLIDNRVGRFKEKSLFARKSFSFGHLLLSQPTPIFNRVATPRRQPRRDAANTLAWYASPRHDV